MARYQTQIAVTKAKCNQCGYRWVTRIAEPPFCPNCRSTRWDKKRQPTETQRTKGQSVRGVRP